MAEGSARLYRQHSIGDLEILVEQGSSNSPVLPGIAAELRMRTTARAKALLRKVEVLLATASDRDPGRATQSAATKFAEGPSVARKTDGKAPHDVSELVLKGLKSHYRSGTDDLGREFFIPCLRACSRYRRAAGFFSSSALSTWAELLPEFVTSKATTIQLLISPILSSEDRATIQRVATPDGRRQALQALADGIAMEAIKFAKSPDDARRRGNLLAWLIAAGRLELRFAFPSHLDDAGMYHEKIGIFTFPDGRSVAFTGSANETWTGHVRNYESIDVFRSWSVEDASRVEVKERQFEEAWNGVAPGLEVVGLSPALMARIKTRRDSQESSQPPASVSRWEHQDLAIQAFLEHERGILEMATGTGKTRTALRICERLVHDRKIETIIVTADGNDLLGQWFSQLVQLNRKLPTGWAVLRDYESHRQLDAFALNQRQRIFLCSRNNLHSALKWLGKNKAAQTLLVHDEVHRLGSPGNRSSLEGLSDNVRFRLGLSATPDREYDTEGNNFIAHHVGPVLFQFDLEQAIRKGILCPFDYYPIEWRASDYDRQCLQAVYKREAARRLSGNPMTQEEKWIEIARVYKASREKLRPFSDFIAQRADLLERSIVFVETQEYGEWVLDIVHRHRSDFHTYFSGEDSMILTRFARRELECLITCHRLSEGIDIQSLKTVVLFSSARARLEMIQRIGRCLRVDASHPNKRASIIDFVRIDESESSNPAENSDFLRREWLTNLSRTKPEV